MYGNYYFIMSDKSDKGTYANNLCYVYENINDVVSNNEYINYINGDVNQRQILL